MSTRNQWWKKWEFNDWLSDPAVGRCSMAGRGVWCELLNLMMKDGAYKVEGTVSDLARAARCSPMEMDMGLKDIERTNVGDVTRCNGVVTVSCRRYRREHNERQATRLRVAKHRGSPIPTADVTAEKRIGNANVTSDSNSVSPSGSTGGGEGGGDSPVPEPTESEFTDHCTKCRILPAEAKDLYLQCQTRHWHDGANVPIRDWRKYVQRRAPQIEEKRNASRSPNNRQHSAQRPTGHGVNDYSNVGTVV